MLGSQFAILSRVSSFNVDGLIMSREVIRMTRSKMASMNAEREVLLQMRSSNTVLLYLVLVQRMGQLMRKAGRIMLTFHRSLCWLLQGIGEFDIHMVHM
jgi:hypothetical protein